MKAWCVSLGLHVSLLFILYASQVTRPSRPSEPPLTVTLHSVLPPKKTQTRLPESNTPSLTARPITSDQPLLPSATLQPAHPTIATSNRVTEAPNQNNHPPMTLKDASDRMASTATDNSTRSEPSTIPATTEPAKMRPTQALPLSLAERSSQFVQSHVSSGSGIPTGSPPQAAGSTTTPQRLFNSQRGYADNVLHVYDDGRQLVKIGDRCVIADVGADLQKNLWSIRSAPCQPKPDATEQLNQILEQRRRY